MAADLILPKARIPGVELAVFDKDGTLMDVHAYWANMVRLRAEFVCGELKLGREHVAGIMEAMGVDVPAMRIKPEGPVGVKKREVVLGAGRDYLLAQGLPDHWDLFVRAAAAVDAESATRMAELVFPLPGLKELLGALSAAGVKIALATTDLTSRAVLCLEQLGVAGLFDAVVGADQITHPKPHPEIIETICGRTGVPASRAVMVGDAPADVNCGLGAGCLASLGLTCGMTPAATLAALTPHVLAGIHEISVSPNRSAA